MTHTLLDSRHTASRARRATWAFTLSLDLVFSAAISLVSFAFQSPRSDCRFGPIAGFSLFCANDVGKTGETTRFTRRPEQTSRRALTAQGDLEGMEHAKQANGSGHELSIGHSPSSAGKKAVRKKAESPRPLRKEAGSKSKSGKLGCRYCGSDDLAPSFIKRRDRRCRKCFSKRYGSAAQARKAKVKK